MTASDVKTAVLHRRLTEHMDTETADALIERLPPDWEQLATKSDLAQLGAELRGEMAELSARMGELSGRVTVLEATVATTVAATKESLEAALVAMEGRINRRAASDLKTMIFTFAGFALAVVGMFVTILVAGVPTAA